MGNVEAGADQIAHLAIYNASEGHYLSTTIDPARQVAIAHTRNFSVFALGSIATPIPMGYLPRVSSQ